MSKEYLGQLVHTALSDLQTKGVLPVDLPEILVEATKDRQHGDFATNIALLLAKKAGIKPKDLANQIVAALPSSEQIARVEVAGPGFINFWLAKEARLSVIGDILAMGERYGQNSTGKDIRVLVEFVSSNPTGPLHVGHGRHGAYGSAVANLLEATGYNVWREYYVNDAGRQMDILATSVWLRYLQAAGEDIPFPANGYRGDYVKEIAQALQEKAGDALKQEHSAVMQGLPADEPEGGDREVYIDAVIARAKELLGKHYETVFDLALSTILADIREDLAALGVIFDSWFSERDFVRTDVVEKVIAGLAARGLTYEKDDALWFRATDFGDEKDRVLRRGNGIHTYFANDLAYHVDKYHRGFERVIDVFGADHHGYIPRMKAGLQASGISPDSMEYLLVQFVTLYRGDEQVQMSTRSGSFVTLRELREEVGKDATRFFYLMRKCGQHVDFDLELAKSHSSDNPVYYIQYAHARICSVFRQLAERNLSWDRDQGQAHLDRLGEPHEEQLLSTLANYPDVVAGAAIHREPQILTAWLRELANDFHACYNACIFLVEDPILRNARLALLAATRVVLVNGLNLLGISAPEVM